MKLLSYRYTPTIVFCVYLLPSSRAAEQTSTMSYTGLSDVLIKTLDGLRNDDFQKFKKNLIRLGEIPTRRLENASVDDTVDELVNVYGLSVCGNFVVTILENIGCKKPADELKLKLELLKSGKLILHSSMLSWLELM